MGLKVSIKGCKDPRTPKAAADGSDTFKTVATLWYDANRNAWVPSHAARVWNRIVADSFPDLGERGVRSITSADALRVLRKVNIVIFGANEAVTTLAVPVLLPGTGATGRGIASIDHDAATDTLTVTMTDGETFQTGDPRPAGLPLSSQQW